MMDSETLARKMEQPDSLFAGVEGVDWFLPLSPGGSKLRAVHNLMEREHYTHSLPSGKSHWFYHQRAMLCFSIPANMNIGRFILKRPCVCWELARLWAPDGHPKNLLTEMIAKSILGLQAVEPDVEVLVSYADPNAGHEGYVYRAASWAYTGRSEDPRGYVDASGHFFPRRKFHSGGQGLKKAEIEARGFKEVFRPGKHRFVKGLTAKARREIGRLWRAVQASR